MQNLYSPVRIRSSPPSQHRREASGSAPILRFRHVSAVVMAMGCVDPPPPAQPTVCGDPRGSTAPHVCWGGGSESGRPLAVLISRPSSPLDQLLADPDIATFLNDRFESWFASAEETGLPSETTLLLTAEGCLLGDGLFRVETPAEWLTRVNQSVQSPASSSHPPQALRLPFLPAEHSAIQGCQNSHDSMTVKPR